jgi:hypothetical protein
MITAKIPEVAKLKIAEQCDIIHHWDSVQPFPSSLFAEWFFVLFFLKKNNVIKNNPH